MSTRLEVIKQLTCQKKTTNKFNTRNCINQRQRFKYI